jgi:Protein of unknown function (DUF732)
VIGLQITPRDWSNRMIRKFVTGAVLAGAAVTMFNAPSADADTTSAIQARLERQICVNFDHGQTSDQQVRDGLAAGVTPGLATYIVVDAVFTYCPEYRYKLH